MAEVTTEQIAAWKAKHGKVYKMEIDGKTVYLRKPTRKDLSAASAISNNNPMKFNEVLIDNCWLDGDEAFKNDVEFYLPLSQKFGEIIQVKEAELKEV